jgi:hypothetical protein
MTADIGTDKRLFKEKTITTEGVKSTQVRCIFTRFLTKADSRAIGGQTNLSNKLIRKSTVCR